MPGGCREKAGRRPGDGREETGLLGTGAEGTTAQGKPYARGNNESPAECACAAGTKPRIIVAICDIARHLILEMEGGTEMTPRPPWWHAGFDWHLILGILQLISCYPNDLSSVPRIPILLGHRWRLPPARCDAHAAPLASSPDQALFQVPPFILSPYQLEPLRRPAVRGGWRIGPVNTNVRISYGILRPGPPPQRARVSPAPASTQTPAPKP